jgi:glucose-6-phosphate isomerase
LLEEWLIYVQYNCDELPNPFNVNEFWQGVKTRFSNLAVIALQAIWMPVASVDVERSFSQYKYILNDRRESLTEENTKRLLLLYYNSDIEGHF